MNKFDYQGLCRFMIDRIFLTTRKSSRFIDFKKLTEELEPMSFNEFKSAYDELEPMYWDQQFVYCEPSEKLKIFCKVLSERCLISDSNNYSQKTKTSPHADNIILHYVNPFGLSFNIRTRLDQLFKIKKKYFHQHLKIFLSNLNLPNLEEKIV